MTVQISNDLEVLFFSSSHFYKFLCGHSWYEYKNMKYSYLITSKHNIECTKLFFKGSILSAERLGLIVLRGRLVQLSEKFQNKLLYFQFQNIKSTWKLLEILRFRFLSKNIAMSQQVP